MRAQMLFFFLLSFTLIQYVANAADVDGVSFPGTDDLDTGGLSRDSFPGGFVFGTAASAYQVEGMANKAGRGPSIWDAFMRKPGFTADNSTADVAIDQYHRYPEDIDLMKKMNFDAYRFSISWSRIFPEGTGRVNWEGVAYYNRLINYMLKKGITPYANLYHYDLPEALEKKYLGLLNEQVIKDYADYADFCFKQFGDRVKNWMTFNEPRVVADAAYNSGFFPPERCSYPFGNCTAGNSATEPYIVAHNMILSHAAAVQRYREKYQKAQNGRIGILLDFVWFEPLTRGKLDNYAAQRARDFNVGWYIHPLTYGEYPRTMQEIVGDRLPKFTENQVKMVKDSYDFVGINQYTTVYISDPHYNGPQEYLSESNDWHAQIKYHKNGVLIGPKANSNWLYVVPWGMYKALMYIKERYGNPTVILSENGRDDPGNVTASVGVHDTARVDYYRSYLIQLKKAIDDGANVAGYFAWSMLDNFEWRSGFTCRFGLVYIDFKNNLARYPKMSAYWFKKLLTRSNN
ncbi:hypothetical protein FNV43_RR26572 [Rhamnella rubrinervis]|uniref:Beta-glucosidase n=1 Tax=Rhamnella rubrinervis TaxID=2594499 RepID=A0A8K0DN88_9ROSA|nr:hypothetical protein FNV43_RR26572 [Rhamnella rubrinervis]